MLLQVARDGLRHAPDNHVQAELAHQLAVHGITKVLLGFPYRPAHLVGLGFPGRPAELLVVHGVHLDFPFLARDENVLYVLLYGNEGACLHVVIAVVFYQNLYGLPGKGELLHLVKDNQRVPLIECRLAMELEQHEEQIQIRQVLEQLFYLRGSECEIENQAKYHKIPIRILTKNNRIPTTSRLESSFRTFRDVGLAENPLNRQFPSFSLQW